MNHMDTRLAKLARGGDRAAFAELVELYKDKIFHLAYRMLHNRHEAEEIVQETFLRVYTNLERYDDQQKFSTWIYRIGTNLCIDRLRKRKISYSLDAEMSDGEGGSDWYATLASQDRTPDQQVALSETQAQIRESIDALPEKYKAVVILRYLQDLSLQEISDALSMPVTTIKTRLHRGREYLRKKLEQLL
ncbi:RNA polymerase sigma-70 factor, ECF subfamily [Paenibacillus sp. UNCCL117]|uniref:RNA polymerase sigma factor SigW n=1 Tax=unclassified Paenibacillus TaxID=185978 RepID=UPI00088C7A8A|nr:MULTISPECIES: RNA polymerase sigma factor SigW [unclassified Paenibacillus]SDE12119.1 RNA polymerase, sigma subunit, SigW [Paenibacillus sp. cl123]SFW60116.1 RNA polymerase sigma-70 factor, ECF subfamily [Paenibacillus sp. UNCCL117]